MRRGLGLHLTWAWKSEQDISGRRWKKSHSGQRKQCESTALVAGLFWQGLFNTYSVDVPRALGSEGRKGSKMTEDRDSLLRK